MPYISHCTIDELAGQSETRTFRMNRHVNVFFGSNGSGKTSLLRFIHSALLHDSKQLSAIPITSGKIVINEVPFNHPEWIADDQIVTRETEIQQRTLFAPVRPIGEVDVDSRGQSRKVWVSSSDMEGSEDAGQPIRHVYLPITRLYATDDNRIPPSLRRGLSASSPISESDLDKFFVESIRLLWLRYTRNLLADIRHAQEAGLRNILYNVLAPESSAAEIAKVEDPKLAYKRLTAFLHRQDSYMLDFDDEDDFIRRLGESGMMRRVVADIERVEEQVEIAQRPRNQFEKLIREMIGGNKSFDLGDRDISLEASNGASIDLGNLSSGEKQLLRICLEALFAGDNPIIIDEPELSMHIDWQRKLIRSLRLLSPSSQIIIATHSPEIMADLSEDSIFEL